MNRQIVNLYLSREKKEPRIENREDFGVEFF